MDPFVETIPLSAWDVRQGLLGIADDLDDRVKAWKYPPAEEELRAESDPDVLTRREHTVFGRPLEESFQRHDLDRILVWLDFRYRPVASDLRTIVASLHDIIPATGFFTSSEQDELIDMLAQVAFRIKLLAESIPGSEALNEGTIEEEKLLELPRATVKFTSIKDCAYRINKLFRSERTRAEARRLIAECQKAHDDYGQPWKGESDWDRRRRIYFEETAMVDAELMDDASRYVDSDLRWQSYKRDVGVLEVGSIPPKVRENYWFPLPDYYYHDKSRPLESLPAGDIQITAWAPTEFLLFNNPKPKWPFPPENIGRPYRLEEIVAALVAIHDVNGRFEPIVPEDDPIYKHYLFGTYLTGFAGAMGSDEWAPALEPLLERVEAEFARLDETDQAGLSMKNEVCQDATESLGTDSSLISAPKKTKRSTEPGEARIKLIAALTKYHKYADGSCLNQEPIGNNTLAELAQVSTSTASEFFKKEFGGWSQYRTMCRDVTRLTGALKLLNNEFTPDILYGHSPPGKKDREDEE